MLAMVELENEMSRLEPALIDLGYSAEGVQSHTL